MGKKTVRFEKRHIIVRIRREYSDAERFEVTGMPVFAEVGEMETPSKSFDYEDTDHRDDEKNDQETENRGENRGLCATIISATIVISWTGVNYFLWSRFVIEKYPSKLWILRVDFVDALDGQLFVGYIFRLAPEVFPIPE